MTIPWQHVGLKNYTTFFKIFYHIPNLRPISSPVRTLVGHITVKPYFRRRTLDAAFALSDTGLECPIINKQLPISEEFARNV